MIRDSLRQSFRTRTLTLLIAGAAALAPPAAALAEPPAGPGAVFPTIEAAALDALRFAAQQPDARRIELGGTIVIASGGYSYPPPQRGNRHGISVRIGASDVAWYYTHGARGDAHEDALNETISARDRRMVDQVDPRRRALYVSTPSGRVLRYGEGRLAVVTRPAAKVARAASANDEPSAQ